MDDCTLDNSIHILEQVMKCYPSRIGQIKIVKHEKNKGLAAARNTAIKYCTGDYLLWVDSDDYIDEKLVEKCVAKQKETNSDIVLFDYFAIYKNGCKTIRHYRSNSTNERTLKLLYRQTPVCVWGGFYNVDLYKKNGVTAVEGVNNNEDYQVTPRLSYYSHKISYIDIPLYYYNCTNIGSITKNFSENHAEQGWKSIRILRDFFKDKGNDYLEALKYAEISRLAAYLKLSVENNNRDYYVKLRTRQKNMNGELMSTIPFSYRIYLYIHSFCLLSIYTHVGKAFKKLF